MKQVVIGLNPEADALRAELDLLSAVLVVRNARLEKADADNTRLRDALERIANEDQTTQWHNAWDIARAALEGTK